MIKTIATTAATVGMLAASLVLGEPSADAASTCRTDLSPGVVTPWEYRHATTGKTPHQIACLYGVRGHVGGGWYGPAGRWHLQVLYPEPVAGFTTYVTFVDVGDTGDNYHLDSTFWTETP